MSAPGRRAALVSVIVIFLDERELLPEAIETVRAQDLTDWELLLCDDGSTDGSTAVAHRAAADDPRIRVLEHPGHENRGMSATRNLGLRNASGDYVALLDADDTWRPDKLREQLRIIREHPDAAMICGASEYWRSWSTGDTGDDVVVPIGMPPDRLYSPPELTIGLYPLGAGAAPCPSDLLFRREAASAVGGFEEHFRDERQLYEDQGFLAKMYLRYPVYVTGECLSRYRQRPDSCVATVTADGMYHDVRRYFLDWFASHLEQHHVGDESVHRALAEARQREGGAGQRPTRRWEPLDSAVGVARRLRRELRRVRG